MSASCGFVTHLKPVSSGSENPICRQYQPGWTLLVDDHQHHCVILLYVSLLCRQALLKNCDMMAFANGVLYVPM